jgi:hypothetical protein
VTLVEDHPVESTLYSLSDAPPAAADSRVDNRTVTLLRVGAITIDGARDLCLIRNVSAGGMMIRAYRDVQVGARVSIELKHGEAVKGSVLWVEDDTVGIEFGSPIDVIELLATSGEGPKPRMPRVEVDCVVTVRQGARFHHVRACDISQGGVKITTERQLEVGGDATVSLAGMAPIAAVVRWRDGGRYGIGFNKPVPVAALVAWLHDQREQMRAAG